MKAALKLYILLILAFSVFAGPTTLSYIIEVEQDERQDFLELTIITTG